MANKAWLLAVSLVLATAAAAAAASRELQPRPWPLQFHALLLQTFHGRLTTIDLWYDWPGGRNFNIMRDQLSSSSFFDLEWTNGTSFFYTPSSHTCRSVHVSVGILRPNWLSGATFAGQETLYGFDCNVWKKADFITYWEDRVTKFPVRWIFYTGRVIDVLTFEEGAAMDDSHWQTPAYCFNHTLDEVGDAQEPVARWLSALAASSSVQYL